ncbi:leucine-, glutamate- and lysine-rich protein 1 [Sinocyclocheilus grahami]|uniref:leucine-, glutamate- and lysine-rich protein 1 n=1 Tax=Sinocyclocheilus grahami TaxID=75366 RepID=UPI0007ACE477|nr:PREDICTED: leucine-, glutamate- and lysine-rich protein 1-like [Sinocyclocheilus grahami]
MGGKSEVCTLSFARQQGSQHPCPVVPMPSFRGGRRFEHFVVFFSSKSESLNNSFCVCVCIRSRFVQQQWLLKEALALLHSSRGEMTTVKNQLTHFLETWENSKVLIQQSCISADAECARLKQQVVGLQVELKRLQEEVPNLKSCLDAAKEQILQLDNQVQTQKLLQNQNQEAQFLIQGLMEEVKTLKIDLQNSMHEREHGKKLLEINSVEKEDLRVLWSEQTATIERLSRDLREKEENRLSCQQRCESMQEQLLAWQQKEEEVTRTKGEMKDLRVARSTLLQEREELRRTHVGELERLEESFRTRLKAAEEQSSKMEAFLQQKQAEQDKQLKQQEMELRREADIELDIRRQKNQELINKYQSEKQQLQNKIPALIHSAVQELHEELAVLQERIKEQEKEMKHVCESASQRQHQLLEERRTGEAQLQSALQELRQKTQELNQAHINLQQLKEERSTLQEEKSFLEETVRRECEEREELTAALTLAKEQLLELKHSITKPNGTQTHTQLSRVRSTVKNPDLPFPRLNPSPPSHPQTHNHSSLSTQSTRQRLPEWNSCSVSRSSTSWHGSSQPTPTLPKISKERVASVNDLCKSITMVRGRRDKL